MLPKRSSLESVSRRQRGYLIRDLVSVTLLVAGLAAATIAVVDSFDGSAQEHVARVHMLPDGGPAT